MQQTVSAGDSYVRWGRTTCPESAQALYTGYMATGAATHTGSGANHVCLHKPAKSGAGNVPGRQEYAARLYGVQYDFNDAYNTPGHPFDFSNLGGSTTIKGNDVPCVVCYNPSADIVIMIPGTPDCPDTMNIEYGGYLVAEWWQAYHRSEFSCLDLAPEKRQGGGTWIQNGLIMPVEIETGSLTSPDFTQFDEVTCVVCSL